MAPHVKKLRATPHESEITALAGGNLTLDLEIDSSSVHNFAGVRYFSDAEGTTPVTPTVGTETYTLQTPLQPEGFQAFTTNVINSADIDQVNWASNTNVVRVVIAGADAAFAKLIVYSNQS